MMSRVIFDIETAGRELESFDQDAKDYLLKWAETDKEVQEVRDSLSFSPLTAEVVCIGMLNPETGKGAVYYQPGPSAGVAAAPIEPMLPFEEDGITFESGTESDVLERFWKAIKGYREFVTFNGRAFDSPFLMVRSAIHEITPTRDLMPNRYSGPHIDLLDRLTFFGAVRRKFNLDMWCKSFGIKSPKGEITGYMVKDIFREGRGLDIARYCVGDLRATAELFDRWDKYIKP